MAAEGEENIDVEETTNEIGGGARLSSSFRSAFTSEIEAEILVFFPSPCFLSSLKCPTRAGVAATGLLMPPDQPYLNGRDGTAAAAERRERDGG